jgi:hypothetical protein
MKNKRTIKTLAYENQKVDLAFGNAIKALVALHKNAPDETLSTITADHIEELRELRADFLKRETVEVAQEWQTSEFGAGWVNV